MKHLFTLLVVCFTIYSTAQDISKLEKEAKKIVVAIQKEDVNSFKKLIVSKKEFEAYINHKDKQEASQSVIENIDSFYLDYINKNIEKFNSKTDELKKREIVLKEVQYNRISYKVTNKKGLIKADVNIILNTYKGDQSYNIKYVYLNKKWIAEESGTLLYGIDMDFICKCIQLDEPTEDCKEYMVETIEIFRDLTDEKQKELEEMARDCEKNTYESEAVEAERAALDAAADAIKVEEGDAAIEEVLSIDHQNRLKAELEKLIPNYCDCKNHSKENPIEGCEDENFIKLIEGKTEDEEKYLVRLFLNCN